MYRKAFTLVELLVTISIMAVIMGASLVAFSGSRATARDGRRKADLESLRSALELYRSDLGGYPDNLNLLVPSYIASVPVDPLATNSYAYSPTCGTRCTSYTLCAAIEVGGAASVPAGCSANCGASCNYRTTNP